ncbi:MAG: hypothetical protein M1834_006868 [Cirrosporium novae-zelandiae]|nr:MAG: hypothetical protein M1834_006868 [Cirrosporium novae-zelandiae]
MAARDRWTHGEPPNHRPSTLHRYIQSACDPSNFEPNLALNLEVADLINTKKGNSPREAAVAIVNYVNHRNPNVSNLALSLLDICVKNCGYPFHLQISTKEFLNELVRRFPERPPIRPTRVQLKILELIEEWRQTICVTSRYKEDLGFIRDMHRLLTYKGYVFPEVKKEDAAVLNPSDNLKSAEEMEEEEKAAQSAKLQELIRRGGPEDLQEANRLMKVMAGFDTRNKTDWRAKAAEEVGKIQQKAKLLEEMLQGFKEGDKMTEGDVFEELANALQSAQPKIQKMCEEESDDSEAVSKLLEINDSIHRTVQRYKLMKKGDLDAASKISKGTLGITTGVKKNADNELSLIDFGGDEAETVNNNTAEAGPTTAAGHEQKETSLEDDLLGLSFQDNNYGQGGGIALGFGATPGPSFSPPPQQLAAGISPSMSPAPPQQTSASSPRPNYNAFAAFTSSNPPSQSTTPIPSLYQQQQQPNPVPAPAPLPASDPFAALRSGAFSPSQPPAQSAAASTPAPASSSLFDLAQSAPPSQQNGSSTPSQPPSTTADDEWNFASALPPEQETPKTNTLTLKASPIRIIFTASRINNPALPNSIEIQGRFENATNVAVSELRFQIAVEKAYKLLLKPQSGRDLAPGPSAPITQHIAITNIPTGSGMGVKMRWKIGYRIGGEAALREEQGEVKGLGIS